MFIMCKSITELGTGICHVNPSQVVSFMVVKHPGTNRYVIRIDCTNAYMYQYYTDYETEYEAQETLKELLNDYIGHTSIDSNWISTTD